MLVVAATLAGKIVDIETRIVRVDPAPYGRVRIGGEITELAEKDRRLIADMALRMPEAGSEAERRNGAAAGSPRAPGRAHPADGGFPRPPDHADTWSAGVHARRA